MTKQDMEDTCVAMIRVSAFASGKREDSDD